MTFSSRDKILLLAAALFYLSAVPAFAQNPSELVPATPETTTVPGVPPNLIEPAPLAEEGIAAPSVDQLAPVPAPAPIVTDGKSVEIPAVTGASANDPDLFFDADTLVPGGEMGTNSPRKVDPKTQPASKLIVVKKNAEAGSQSAQLVSAQRALKLGRYEAALDMYDRLYEKNRRDPRILMGRAVALQHLGRFDAAMLAYEELLDIDSRNIEAKINMLGLLGSKYPAVALQRLVELRQKNPENVGIVAQLAVMEAKIGNLPDAMRYLGIAASMEPNNASHVYNLAVIADRAGEKAEAISYYEQALEIDTIYGRGESIPRESVYERLARLR